MYAYTKWYFRKAGFDQPPPLYPRPKFLRFTKDKLVAVEEAKEL